MADEIKIHLEDLIGHRKISMQLRSGADLKELLQVLAYEEYDLYHTVNGKHKRFDYVLSEGDEVVLIPVLGGG
jgi:molybdopterin converting factor small subunit